MVLNKSSVLVIFSLPSLRSCINLSFLDSSEKFNINLCKFSKPFFFKVFTIEFLFSFCKSICAVTKPICSVTFPVWFLIQLSIVSFRVFSNACGWYTPVFLSANLVFSSESLSISSSNLL